jgi:endonuclease III
MFMATNKQHQTCDPQNTNTEYTMELWKESSEQLNTLYIEHRQETCIAESTSMNIHGN